MNHMIHNDTFFSLFSPLDVPYRYIQPAHPRPSEDPPRFNPHMNTVIATVLLGYRLIGTEIAKSIYILQCAPGGSMVQLLRYSAYILFFLILAGDVH